jgi:predicted esterase
MLLAALLALAQAPPASPPAQPLIQATAVSPTHGELMALPDDAVAYRPASAGPHPPLLVLLHGAGRERFTMIQHFEAEADRRGVVLLAPTSKGPTWDAVLVAEEPPPPDSVIAERIGNRFGGSRDSRRVETAIANLKKVVPVDPARIVLAGFSDGATFALAMGMSRDYPFEAVIAWSPGIAIRSEEPARGRPVFVSHGRQDPILNFDTTCAAIVPLLQSEGAKLTFVPFDGVHEAPVWLKDTFLDAVFGKAPGSEAHPLPASIPTCHAPGMMSDQPTIPTSGSMMGPH